MASWDGSRADRWRIHVDTGGTFTDCVAIEPGGGLHRVKVLSDGSLRGTVAELPHPRRVRVRESWGAAPGFAAGMRLRLLGDAGESAVVREHGPGGVLELDRPHGGLRVGAAIELLSGEAAPVLAARLATGAPRGTALPLLEVRLATTRATNALLERRGAPAALFVTRGFGDLLRIGTQQRPDLFTLRVRRPEPLTELAVEVRGRIGSGGEEIEPLDLAALESCARAVLDDGVRSAAVALVNAHSNPAHEQAVGAFLRSLGFDQVALSTDLARVIGFHVRAETAVVEAYLAPVVGAYLSGVEAGLGPPGERSRDRPRIFVMTSAGGLATPGEFRAADALLSGPAAGVVGAAQAGFAAGFRRLIAFDMGGTSTDVARIDGELAYRWEHRVGGARLLAPSLAIETVAAGGGSTCSVDRGALRVGPESAGSSPGPACYGTGGPLTLTDVNLLLGRLDAASFGIPVEIGAAGAAFAALRERLASERAEQPDADALLLGLLEIANERMAEAIRAISLREGYDPAEHALVAFGGAGGQHACAVAERLAIRRIVAPADASLLSAWGLERAVLERFAQRQLLRPVEAVQMELERLDGELVTEAMEALEALGVPRARAHARRRVATLRFAGQESTLTIPYEPGGRLAAAFQTRYREIFGHLPEALPVEVESLRVIAATHPPPTGGTPPVEHVSAGSPTSARCLTEAGWRMVPVHERAGLGVDAVLEGPALVREPHTSIYLASGWRARRDGQGALLLERDPSRVTISPSGEAAGEASRRVTRRSGDERMRPAAVVEELFSSRFEAIARQMGEQLRRTAFSTNIRERLDFSCALLDRDGALVANAPHIPVHLGALGLCVREVVAALPLRPGDVAVTNHPRFGGSHLPDVTVITPVHDPAGELIGYLASRAHHAELGGSRPGSWSPERSPTGRGCAGC